MFYMNEYVIISEIKSITAKEEETNSSFFNYKSSLHLPCERSVHIENLLSCIWKWDLDILLMGYLFSFSFLSFSYVLLFILFVTMFEFVFLSSKKIWSSISLWDLCIELYIEACRQCRDMTDVIGIQFSRMYNKLRWLEYHLRGKRLGNRHRGDSHVKIRILRLNDKEC